MIKSILCLILFGLIFTSCEPKTTVAKTDTRATNTIDRARSLSMIHRFNVAPQAVFDAFTKPEAMRVWWTETTTFDMNVEVGGSWTINRTQGETVYTATGEYIEVAPPHRLIYTYGMPQFTPNSDTITIDIVSDGKQGSVLTFKVRGSNIADELSGLPGGGTSNSEKGWRMGFDLMTNAWESQRSL